VPVARRTAPDCKDDVRLSGNILDSAVARDVGQGCNREEYVPRSTCLVRTLHSPETYLLPSGHPWAIAGSEAELFCRRFQADGDDVYFLSKY
jgi:hypothetical protein